jgi:serine/threonine protein kinase
VGLHGSETEAPDFGRYRLWGLLGRGGMGEVYRAYDTGRDRIVALKLLPPQLAGDADFIARFRRESRLAARLRDPHVVPIHDFGEVDGRLFIDMRLVEGTDLAALLAERHRMEPGRAVHLVSQVAAALDAAHRDGLVHRDVKPSNVLVTEEDHVYLTDFGIAHSTDATALTGTGTALGTIQYMAPERFLHGRGDRRMDVYSLGCLLYEVLTGRRPFEGDEVPAQMYAHVHLPPPRPSALVPGLPPALDDVVVRAMAKDPAERFDTAGALAAAARVALGGAPVPGGPLPHLANGSTLRATAHLGASSTPPGPARPGSLPPGSFPPGPFPPGPPPSGSLPPGLPQGATGTPHDPWRRRALVAAAIAAVAVVAAGVTIVTSLSGGSGDTATRSLAAPTVAANRGSAPSVTARVLPGLVTTSAAATGTTGRIGEAVRDGGIEVTVSDARYADAIDVGNEYSGYKATPAGTDARYVVVRSKVLNDTAKSISPGCLGGISTAVLDDRDRRFDTISETSQVKGNSTACFPAVQPGFSVDVTFVYKVPKSANVARFVFKDQTNFAIPDAGSPGVALEL